MINKIVAIQGNHPSKLNPNSDTSVFLANEIQNKNYKIFYYNPKNLSIIDEKSQYMYIEDSIPIEEEFSFEYSHIISLHFLKYILLRQKRLQRNQKFNELKNS